MSVLMCLVNIVTVREHRLVNTFEQQVSWHSVGVDINLNHVSPTLKSSIVLHSKMFVVAYMNGKFFCPRVK